MPNPRPIPVCRNHNFIAKYLTHMYYIYFIKNLYINTSKKKRTGNYLPTTPTTTLKPAPAATYLSYPRCFCMVTTWLRQPATKLFFSSNIRYSIDSLCFAFCRMS
jgi:hypothetical protein